MDELIARALNTAQLRGAVYADVRVVETARQSLLVRNGAVQGIAQTEDAGFGVRVVVDGAWGFASSHRLERTEAERVAELAVRIARSSALAKREDVDLGPPVVQRGSYRTPVEIDPFTVPLETKLDLLLRADGEMRRIRGVTTTEAEMVFIRERKIFASTEGSYITQEILESGCGIEATAVRDGEVQRRSYPNSVGRHQQARGWEFILEQDLVANAPRIAEEAVALLSADLCPDTVTTLILGGAQVALQIHESCGHAVELDRVFGAEAAYAGTSFLTPEKLGRFRYGSEVVNIVADATAAGGLGTFGWDDEGVPAQRVDIVREGLFVGYLTDRENARRLLRHLGPSPYVTGASGGAARAMSWNRIPLIRMTNINLLPGAWRLEDLIADTEEGIFMDTNRSWSIDDRRLNFQFGCEIAWEIRRGRKVRLLRNPLYTGITPEFWRSCDAVCNEDHWVLWGTPNCGKGEPGQIARTGHGAAPARFRNVRVFGKR
ncbi:MAG: TldD/PmbA family protein [Armatimonadota bacterium]|nr:TldD/PmbA family protein [Armatimonadota bacterium]MDR7439551.1 TldD/PmbA family protein [Armatimonadota bacterium]MDR7443213.1 TldD/PmbA family protein [Armatimonadota bacterium]MDR7563716.1 TldD/PmbA family protein [Armatimonadota bacterium]MDR7567917.1 TldD/PmbA family protein [Armatimonadota bacterium]